MGFCSPHPQCFCRKVPAERIMGLRDPHPQALLQESSCETFFAGFRSLHCDYFPFTRKVIKGVPKRKCPLWKHL